MKFISERLRHYWRITRDFCVYKVLHADDPPHRLALGIAIGIFVTFLPLIGIQMVVSVFLAWLCRANKVVGVPLVWISNPFTMVPIYYPCYLIGCQLLGRSSDEWQEVYPNFIEILTAADSTWGEIFNFCWTNLLDFVAPLSVGSLMVASVLGVLTYYLSLYAIRSYRLKRWGQLMPPSATPQESIQDDQVADVEISQSVPPRQDQDTQERQSNASEPPKPDAKLLAATETKDTSDEAVTN